MKKPLCEKVKGMFNQLYKLRKLQGRTRRRYQITGIQFVVVQIGYLKLDTHVIARRFRDNQERAESIKIENFVIDTIKKLIGHSKVLCSLEPIIRKSN